MKHTYIAQVMIQSSAQQEKGKYSFNRNPSTYFQI